MKGLKIFSMAAVVFLGVSLTVSGCGLFPEEEEVLAPPLEAPAEVSYVTETVTRGDIIDSVTVSGTFISTSSYDLSFEKRSGYLSEVLVKAGDTVEEGQLLARLDTDELEMNIKKQELAVEKAQISLDMARTAENATPSSIRLAEIEYELQKLSLDEMEDELSKQSIVAPADGVVSFIEKTGIGEYVAARSTLIRIVDPQSVQLECTDEKVADFHLDQEVVVTLDNKEYKGKVVMTSADAPISEQSDEIYVRIEVTDELPAQELLGKNATVELIREEKKDVLVVPRNVVSMYAGESYVLVLEDGVKKERIIETGIKNSTEIEVLSGLEEGEEIIIK